MKMLALLPICIAFSMFALCGSKAKEASIRHKQLRNNLQGKELNIVTGNFPPVISIWRNSTGHIIGFSDRLYYQLLYLSQKLNFTYRMFAARENTNGIKRNGTWNGIIGTLQREEADLGLVPVAISLERYEAIEFCGQIGGDYTSILVKYPDAIVSFTSAFDVFPAGIWIGWIISTAAIIGMSMVLTRISKRLRIGAEERGVVSTDNFAWYMYSVIISQGGYFGSTRSPQKLLAATWCIAAFIFVNIYSSTLTFYMSVTYQKPQINSFSDLAASLSYRATILIGSIQEIDLLRTKKGVLKIVSDRIEKCSSDCRKFTLQEIVVPVLEEENYVSILPWSIAVSALQKYNSERVKCRLAVAYETMSWKPMFFAVPKASPYIEEINRESLWFIDTGLRDYWVSKNGRTSKQCQLNYNSEGVSIKRASHRITLEQFYLPFLILFCGYFLAFLQLCREKFCYSCVM